VSVVCVGVFGCVRETVCLRVCTCVCCVCRGGSEEGDCVRGRERAHAHDKSRWYW